MHSDIAMDCLARLTAEQRLIGRIMGADWSVGAVRVWPDEWFQNIDWNKIPSLAWQYKLRPMTAAASREAGWPGVPGAVRAALETSERECVTKSLRQISLLRDVAAAANAQDIRVIVMKGVALSAHLYGDPVIREAFDLDLLIHPEDAEPLDKVLHVLGCKAALHAVPLTPRQEAILKRFHHDKRFVHADSGIIVERHYALDRNPHLIATDFDGLWYRRASAQIGDYSAAILGESDLANYLGIHAARHAWERWKWIADLAVLYRRATVGELLHLREEAERTGMRHLFNSWILLVAATTGLALPSAIAQSAVCDRKARHLAARALRISSIAHTPATIRSRRYGLRTTLYRFLLKRGFKPAVFELITLFQRDEDWYAWRLPDRLIPFYYLLRPFAFVYRRIASFIRP